MHTCTNRPRSLVPFCVHRLSRDCPVRRERHPPVEGHDVDIAHVRREVVLQEASRVGASGNGRDEALQRMGDSNRSSGRRGCMVRHISTERRLEAIRGPSDYAITDARGLRPPSFGSRVLLCFADSA